MGSSRKARASDRHASSPEHDNTPAVVAYLEALEHPLKPVVEAIRTAILRADPAITEGVKWNSASFYRHGWFATINVQARSNVRVILHHGARVRDDGTLRRTIDDSAELLKWLADDRAVVAFSDAGDFAGKRKALTGLIRQWAAYQARFAEPA